MHGKYGLMVCTGCYEGTTRVLYNQLSVLMYGSKMPRYSMTHHRGQAGAAYSSPELP